jgi:hypothetical protein
MLAYGGLKVAAMKADAAAVRRIIKDNGADDCGLTDEQLVVLWSVNEHINLHAVLFGNKIIKNTIHMTSLNSNPGPHDPSASQPKTLGGYNDEGAYRRWGWHEAALKFNQHLNV